MADVCITAPRETYEGALKRTWKELDDEFRAGMREYHSLNLIIEKDIRAGRKLTSNQRIYKEMAESCKEWPVVFSKEKGE